MGSRRQNYGFCRRNRAVHAPLWKGFEPGRCREKEGRVCARKIEGFTEHHHASRLLPHAQVPYFALYELRHTFATRLSAGGVADHMVTQMLRQGDADVFKLYSQAKLGMMREALAKLDRKANERRISSTEKAS